MATCPKCETPLREEYGMSQCPACGAFSFIDLEGVAVISEPEQESEIEQPNPSGAAAPPDFADPIESLLETDSINSESFGDFAEMPPIDTPPSPESNPSEIVNAEFQSFDIGATSEAEPPTLSYQGFGPAGDPLNLNEFANSEVSSAKDGPLLFRVLISGIDTKEIRDSIREVIEDSRFAWDSKEIFSKISKGHLAVSGLSPVKASILITRIKYLPVSIRWEQYAITQGPPS